MQIKVCHKTKQKKQTGMYTTINNAKFGTMLRTKYVMQ